MQDAVPQLKTVLNQQLAVYRQLLELSRRKRKLLMEKFSTDLIQIVSEEEKQVTQLAALDDTRLACIEALAGNPRASLDEALEKVAPPDVKSDLWMLGTQLKDVIAEIRLINEENQKLLEQALELTQYSIRLITNLPKDITYSPTGPGKTRPLSALIDRKA